MGGRAVADGAAQLQATVPLVRGVFVGQGGVGCLGAPVTPSVGTGQAVVRDAAMQTHVIAL